MSQHLELSFFQEKCENINLNINNNRQITTNIIQVVQERTTNVINGTKWTHQVIIMLCEQQTLVYLSPVWCDHNCRNVHNCRNQSQLSQQPTTIVAKNHNVVTPTTIVTIMIITIVVTPITNVAILKKNIAFLLSILYKIMIFQFHTFFSNPCFTSHH